ncbi:MAG: YfbR-like 5'-deoxynucleotidase [Paracoccaceae bacterium]
MLERAIISDLYAGGGVLRYHTNPVIAKLGQCNAAHQWGCAAMILALHPDPSRNLIAEAILHDAGELDCGDMSGPYKRGNPEFAQMMADAEERARQRIGAPAFDLTDEEHEWLNFVDKMECVLHIRLYLPHLIHSDRAWHDLADRCLECASGLGCWSKGLEEALMGHDHLYMG